MSHTPLRARLRSAVSMTVLGAIAMPSLVTALFVPCRSAAAQETRVLRVPGATVYGRASDRAVLGVVMAAGSRADTAGVHLEEVEPNSPAAKAGLKAGDIITEINGTSLRVAKEDADDLALAGLAQRRLQRVLAKAKPGDEVTLRVRSGTGAARTVAVKTVSQADLDRDENRRVVERTVVRDGGRERVRMRSDSVAQRGMVGITIGGAGNARDTLGLFVNSVVTGGPADKAGIVEGERVAAINGVDVRLPKEDVDDAEALSSRIERFVREVRKAEPGKTVSLRVYGGGRYRDVSVTAAKASDLPATGFSMSVGDGTVQIMTPRAPRPPLPPGTPDAPRVRIFERDGSLPRIFEFDADGEMGRLRLDGRELRIDREQLRRSIEEMRRGIEEGMRGFEFRAAPMRSRRAVNVIL